ncbi:MAG TPA: hypothetical protein VMF91_12970, partial [Bryobacteraceae bacterium]|nr:hypothetical protein [Bryobacteraceae bacterium]
MILRALSRAGVCGVLFVLAAGRVLGKGPDGRGDDPYVAYHCALDAAHEPTRALRAFIAAVKADAPPPPLKHSCVALIAGRSKTKSGSGNWFLLLAELMKSVGDYNAPQW